MTDRQQITPPPELIKEWMSEFNGSLTWPGELALHTANRAAEWGYDQRGEVNEAKLQKARDEELEACCEWLDRIAYRQSLHIRGSHLRDARRQKPPSLKEQALEEVRAWKGMGTCNINIIIRALKAIPDE